MYVDRIPTVLNLAYEARQEIVLCFMGAPGIGKTQSIYEFAKTKNANVVEIIASQILPSEVSGLTMPDHETKSMQVYDHARLASLKDGDILFFDELLQAPKAVLSACLTLIQERRLMSGRKLPDVMIVAACNPIARPSMIEPQIRQRFMWLAVNTAQSKWADYIEETYHLNAGRISNYLESVSCSARDWNEFTPRTATKLLYWMMQFKDQPTEQNIIRSVITEMFHSSLADEYKKLFDDMNQEQKIEYIKDNNDDVQQQIREKIGSYLNNKQKEKINDRLLEQGETTMETTSLSSLFTTIQEQLSSREYDLLMKKLELVQVGV